ncbi:hypothetical protein [Alsobacter sp. R-9]
MARTRSIAGLALASSAMALALAPWPDAARAQERPWVDPPLRIEPAPEPAPAQPPPAPAQPLPAPAQPLPPLPQPAPQAAPAPPQRAPAPPQQATPAPKPAPQMIPVPPPSPPSEHGAAPPPPDDRPPQRPALARPGPVEGPVEAAEDFVRRYLEAWSRPNAEALAAMPEFYGERVTFHGRSRSFASLMREKVRFVRRWPERDYRPRQGDVTVRCHPDGLSCRVSLLVDFDARGRGRTSSGVTTLDIDVRFVDGRPVIASETSRVVERVPGADDDSTIE